MLKLKPDPTFVAPVKIPTPSGEVAIKMTFKHRTRDEYEAFIKSETESKRKDEEAIMDMAVDWSGVDTPFSAEAVAELCQTYHAAPRVIAETYIRELTQAKLGN